MHMADVLISPAVGGTMWAVSAGATIYSAKKVQNNLDDRKIPLMGVLGAFIFAAQMINFSIPGTGSSGHLGGALILSILLGPYAAFLTMVSILTVQALFFGDGGLLALGCNMVNMAFFTCFITYPLVYRRISGSNINQTRIVWGAMSAAVIGLQLGSGGVVLETVISGISGLPFKTFVLLMQPIHLAIGIVEGLVTAAVVGFVWKARPEILESVVHAKPIGSVSIKKVVIGLGIAAVLTGGGLSWFASASPDGLEWSIFRASGKKELVSQDKLHRTAAKIQQKTVFLPDYGFQKNRKETAGAKAKNPSRPGVNTGTSVSGLVGGGLTLLIAGIIGLVLRFVKKTKSKTL